VGTNTDEKINEPEIINSEGIETSTSESDNEQVINLKDQLMRSLADYENLKRRKEQEILSILEYGNEKLLKDLLPIYDDLQRSLVSGSAEGNADVFFNGITLIKNNFDKVFAKYNVEKIECVGSEFDVNFHEALMNQPSDSPEGTVITELEAGYMYNGKVLRHSKVIVSSGN